MTKKALLFVNGEFPQYFPNNLNQYKYIACTDGAYHNYLENSGIIPHFIIGDLDSLHHQKIPHNIQIIHKPDQNKTDFEKALLFLANKNIQAFDIYGASGKASDHFLGNLSVAMQYAKQLELTFYDNFCRFFFAKSNTVIDGIKDKIISLIPLTPVYDLTITGVEYPLTHANLQLGGVTSLRNRAIEEQININFTQGDLLIFIAL